MSKHLGLRMLLRTAADLGRLATHIGHRSPGSANAQWAQSMEGILSGTADAKGDQQTQATSLSQLFQAEAKLLTEVAAAPLVPEGFGA